MSRKTNIRARPLPRLETVVSEISATRSTSLQPYIKLFFYEPENVAHEPLGTLVGLFAIDRHTLASAYIVNFLASVSKKEYFANTRRGAVESLENTLHKINLALAELARQDNTEWLGHLHAAICVLERNNIHFSVTGEARVFLLRNQVLSEVSEGLASAEALTHPLKTFTDVSSGRLEDGDQVIATTPELLAIVNSLELERTARRLSEERFIQFLRTALVNQTDFGAALHLGIRESAPVVAENTVSLTSQKPGSRSLDNVFSQIPFQSEPKTEASRQSIVEVLEAPTEEELAAHKEYTDTQTRHIYVQGEHTLTPDQSERWERVSLWFESLRSFLARLRRQCIFSIKRMTLHALSWTSEISVRGFHWMRAKYGEWRVARTQNKISKSSDTLEPLQTSENSPRLVERLPWIRQIRQISLWTATRIHIPRPRSGTTHLKIQNENEKAATWRARASAWFQYCVRIWQRRTPKTKKLILASILAIVFVPAIIGFTRQSGIPAPPETPPATETAPAPTPFAQDKNMHLLLEEPVKLAERDDVVSLVFFKGVAVAATRHALLLNEQGTSFETEITLPVSPDSAGNVTLLTVMPDFNAIFMLTDKNQVYSFTPSNKAFTENKISWPDNATITALGAYLTYLYAFDSNTGQIYRFPRAEGGFGEKTDWLKTPLTAKGGVNLALSESLYLAESGRVMAFNRGQPETSLDFENSATPIQADLVYTESTLQNIYVLDRKNGRLVTYTKTGQLENQYAHETLKQASSFIVSEADKQIFFTTPEGVLSLTLE